jgi:glucokinase
MSAHRVSWSPMADSLIAGLDLGGTKISAALVDSSGAVLHRIKQPAGKGTFAESVAQIAGVFRRLVSESAIEPERISGIGACVPGIYCAETGKAWAPNLWGRDEVPLRDALARELPAPVTLDSDRAAYVLGEQWLGAARGLTDVIFLAVGTGIGAGIITGGRLCRGAGDIAGAVGWFVLDRSRKEIYKQIGCFEAEAAGPGVARRAGAKTAEEVVAAARRGDAAALANLGETARLLGMGVANLISAFNPQMVVLGGGLMQAGDLLLEPLRSEMLQWAQPFAAKQVRIELSRLGEDAGLLGAARLPLVAGSI